MRAAGGELGGAGGAEHEGFGGAWCEGAAVLQVVEWSVVLDRASFFELMGRPRSFVPGQRSEQHRMRVL